MLLFGLFMKDNAFAKDLEAKTEKELLGEETLDPSPPESIPAKKSHIVSATIQKQADDPLPAVLNFQIQNFFIPSTYGKDGFSNALVLEPVIPIVIDNFPDTIIRPCFTVLATTTEGTTGVGDFFYLQAWLLPPGGEWGAWGIGPVIVFPTATSKMTGQGKWQAGPFFSFSVNIVKNWQFGILIYNPISFAGDDTREAVNTLYFQPTATYNLPDGWFVGLGSQTHSFNWKNGGAPTLFASVQGGRVFKIGSQPVSLGLAPFYAFLHDGATPRYGAQFTWTFLFPTKYQKSL